MPKRTSKSGEVMFVPKYSQKLQEFIADKIEGGMTLSEVCKEYGPPKHDACPNEKTCYRWKKKYPEFKKALDEAYQTLIFKMMDEMNDLSKEIQNLDREWDKFGQEMADDIESGDLSPMAVKAKIAAHTGRLRDKRDAAKIRLRALEFMLTRIAPKLVPDLKEASQNTVAHLPPITVINFAPKNIEGYTYEATKEIK